MRETVGFQILYNVLNAKYMAKCSGSPKYMKCSGNNPNKSDEKYDQEYNCVNWHKNKTPSIFLEKKT